MAAPDDAASLEEQIEQWRSHLRQRRAIHSVDAAELEDHLREQVAVLTDAGLSTDEAFLVAVKRMGGLDSLSEEFAREHSDRLWKQLVVSPSDPEGESAAARRDAIAACCFAVAAALATQLPVLFGVPLEHGYEGHYRRNLGLFVLPLLTGYFAWKRRLDPGTLRWLGVAFSAAVVFANVYPFVPGGSTDRLTALHLPIALWLAVGVAYAGGRWSQLAGRMDFIRFSGELLVYALLITFSGGVLTEFMMKIFQAVGIDAEPWFALWLLPSAAGAVVVTAWLVDAKKSVIENMAPVLTRLFTPLLVAVVAAFLGSLLLAGRGIDIERGTLVTCELLLVAVLGVLVFSVSARDPQQPPGTSDAMQLVLAVSALVADGVALWAVAARISALGLSPYRAAALGLNVILLVNLAWSAVLYLRFLRGRGAFTALERWQTDYLPVYAAWSAIVVIAFPPLFGYV